MIVTLTKAPEVDYRGYFRTWDLRLNGETVGYLFADLNGKYTVTDTYSQPVTQNSTIKAAYRVARNFFGRGA